MLDSMDNQDRSRLESVLSYDDDTAGGLMSFNALTVRPDVSLDVVLRYLRLKKEMPELTDSLIVVDRNDVLIGMLPLSTLLTNDPQLTVAELMDVDVHGIPALLSATEVALLFEQRNLVSAPVVDDQGRLQGRITIDDVVDVIRDEADHSIMSMAGLDEEQDMFAPVVLSAKRRALWLGVNLFTAFLASWVIAIHELALEHIVALAILMPIVASMGGIAGSQTLTIVIRGLALRQIGRTNAHVLIVKELLVGGLNGGFWALVVAMISGFWFESVGIGLVLGSAMMITLVFAALAGALIPLILQQINIDPALAGGVMLTTVTDMIGFWAFLGLATVFLL
jgi:magnesium transporter